jgi:2-polyprenyl-6-methoxyphenol hydroxylase-like FAD-dependent oxidoreductase
VFYDVIIAGAGPVGLFLACELSLAHCSVLVLEQATDPHGPLKRVPFGMRGLSVPTVEALYRRGLLDDITAATPPPNPDDDHRPPGRRAGHFAGIDFVDDDIDSATWPWRLPSPADTNLAAEMEHIETVLTERATDLGVEIRRGHGVTDFTQTGEEVTVRTATSTDRAPWLVGCDGGRSTVRKKGGFTFPGTAPQFTGYMIAADLADDEDLHRERTRTPAGMYLQSDPGVMAMLDFDGGASHRSTPLTAEHVQSVLRRVSGTAVRVTRLHVATTWTDRAQQAATYRHGRVLLAGDAAHIHSPLGAQGLNVGLGDAMNLGWKLAATLGGYATDTLLDTYHAERHPIGAQVLDWSRAQTAVMAPTAQARALDALLTDLIHTPAGVTFFAERMWNVSHRYDLGAAHPLVGRSAPDFHLPDGTTVGDLLRHGNGVLLDFDAAAPLNELKAPWADRFTYICAPVDQRLGLVAVLIRPDGVVAWASDHDPTPTPADAARAAARWLTPSPPQQ